MKIDTDSGKQLAQLLYESFSTTGIFGNTEMPEDMSQLEAKLVALAKQDLAEQLNIEIGEIQLVKIEPFIWPDTSLGCPWPGMRYQQVPQDGARIILRVHGEQRVYHSGGQRAPFPCDHK